MKQHTNILFSSLLLLALIGFNACKNKDLDIDSFKIERERVVPAATNVTIMGSYSFTGEVYGMKVNIGEKENLIDASSYEMQLEGTDFSVTVENLKPSTEYYYRYSINFGTNDASLTETKSFTTLDAETEIPTVKIYQYPLFNEDSTFVRVKCEVVADGGSVVTERGILWNNLGDPVEGDSIIQHANGGLGIYTINLEHLSLGKTYYVRAYAKNEAGIGLSDDILEIKTNAQVGTSVNIELSSNPEEGGLVSGGGSYEVGTQCTVTAVANTGYTFINWTENEAQVSSQASYTFTVTTGRSLVANFTKQAYVITAQVDPEDSGTVTGAGGFNYGEECILTATAKTGYDFERWTKGSTTVSTNAEYSFTVTESAAYVAHFQIKSYSVSVSANPTNGGTMTGGGTYNYGQSCSVQAEPAEGFTFANWTDDGDVISENANYTFTVTGNRNLVANFETQVLTQYTINVSANPSNGGMVTGGGNYPSDQSCTVTATANSGYTFTNWTEGNNVVSNNTNYTFTVNNNRTLVAHFSQATPTEYNITTNVTPEGSGTVTGGGGYHYGDQVTLTANPNDGYTFDHWQDGDNHNPRTIIVTGDATYTATFKQEDYIIITEVSPTGSGTVTGGGSGFHYGDQTILTAYANNGYSFVRWQDNITQNPRTITVNGDATYTAILTQDNYIITTNVSPEGAGIVEGGGAYHYGDQPTLRAAATSGYEFQSWNDGNTQNPRIITVIGNATYTAYFTTQPQAPQGAINGQFTINANGDKVYFSQGNLQYQASTNTWRFATNQYDYIGDDNSNISQTYSGWIDLFGWGTSGWDNGNVYFQPYNTQNNGNSSQGYGYGPTDGTNYTYDLTGTYSQADWGVHNSISGTTGSWRTLTGGNDNNSEWYYVLNSRITSSGIRYAKAQMNGVNGVILLPDDWNASYYNLSLTNTSGASFTSNTITVSQWDSLEQHGAVFLPAAGRRGGTRVYDVDSYGLYWSAASYYNSSRAYGVSFSDGGLGTNYNNRYNGFAVRLVCPCQ